MDKSENIQQKADVLRQEAKDILQSHFKIFPPYRETSLDRLIDCIIGVAVLESQPV